MPSRSPWKSCRATPQPCQDHSRHPAAHVAGKHSDHLAGPSFAGSVGKVLCVCVCLRQSQANPETFCALELGFGYSGASLPTPAIVAHARCRYRWLYTPKCAAGTMYIHTARCSRKLRRHCRIITAQKVRLTDAPKCHAKQVNAKPKYSLLRVVRNLRRHWCRCDPGTPATCRNGCWTSPVWSGRVRGRFASAWGLRYCHHGWWALPCGVW